MPSPTPNANIARHLDLMAGSQPRTTALKVPRGRTSSGEIDYLTLSYAELAGEVASWRQCLVEKGVVRGDRTLVMVRPGLPLIASVFALFQLGAVPVVIDPGMGLRSFLACVKRSHPRVLLGIPMARLVRHIFRPPFRSVEIVVPASSSLTARLTSVPTSNFQLPTSSPQAAQTPNPAAIVASATDLAAILFTSGSTGAPKGVCYEHGMFEAQVTAIRTTYGVEPGEIDLPMLPIFALFNPALGMTTVVPEIDPRRPADVDPAKIVQAIQQEHVTNSFGSPTLWRKIFRHCEERGVTLPTLRRVLCAGAPVPPALYRTAAKILSRGTLHSPYGATEALPVSSAATSDVLAPTTADKALVRGTYVGLPISGVDVRVIAISDNPIASLADTREMPRGEIGEIIARGPMVTKEYDGLPEATAAAKIRMEPSNKNQVTSTKDENGETPSASLGTSHLVLDTSAPRSGAVWHRMGDCGIIDENGALWFCGRKVERVETDRGTLFTDPCEQVFRAAFPEVRCALIGLGARGHQRPAIVLEEDAPEGEALREKLAALARTAASQPHTSSIGLFLFNSHFPVDVRHNAKIHRLALARWAASAKAYRSDN